MKKLICYVDYMDKSRNFKTSREEFSNYENAKLWCIENLSSFNPDYIKFY